MSGRQDPRTPGRLTDGFLMLGSQSTAKVIGVKHSSSIMPRWTSDSLFTYNATLYGIKKQAFSSAFLADRILNSVSLVPWVRKVGEGYGCTEYQQNQHGAEGAPLWLNRVETLYANTSKRLQQHQCCNKSDHCHLLSAADGLQVAPRPPSPAPLSLNYSQNCRSVVS